MAAPFSSSQTLKRLITKLLGFYSYKNVTPEIAPQNFRYLEWIYITAHFGVGFNSSTFSFPIVVGFYGIFFVLGWLYPNRCPYWQRLTYIITGIAIAVIARNIGVDIGLFVSFYIAKSYFLLHRRQTIFIAIITGFAWTASEYFAQFNRLQLSPSPSDTFNFQEPFKFIFFNVLIYTASNCFVIAFSAMMVAEEKAATERKTSNSRLNLWRLPSNAPVLP